VKIPEGIETKNPRATALKLKKAIYGLKQAAREWFKLLETFLQEDKSFEQSEVDKCLFKGKKEKWKGYIVIAVYVDDFTAAVEREEDWQEFEKKFQGRFPISASGDLSWLLGLKVEAKPEENKIMLSQSQSILDVRFLFLLSLSSGNAVLDSYFLLGMPKSFLYLPILPSHNLPHFLRRTEQQKLCLDACILPASSSYQLLNGMNTGLEKTRRLQNPCFVLQK